MPLQIFYCAALGTQEIPKFHKKMMTKAIKWGPKVPKRLQKLPKAAKRHPRAPQGLPKGGQVGPRGYQGGVKRA